VDFRLVACRCERLSISVVRGSHDPKLVGDLVSVPCELADEALGCLIDYPIVRQPSNRSTKRISLGIQSQNLGLIGCSAHILSKNSQFVTGRASLVA